MSIIEKKIPTLGLDVNNSNNNDFSFQDKSQKNIENLIEQIWSMIHKKLSLEELKNLEDKIPELKEKLKDEKVNKNALEKMIESLQKYITKHKEDIQSNNRDTNIKINPEDNITSKKSHNQL